MDDQLKISIIVPVYNAEKYLDQCLNSLLDQGMLTEQYEVICINDGSKDASFSIIHAFSHQHPNVIVIDKENEGVSAARNTGLDAAHGKYVWFIDADDWIAKDFLKNAVTAKLFSDDYTNVPLILTNCINVHNSDAEKYADYLSGELKLEESHPFMTTARGHFFDRSLIEKYHLRFDTNLAYGEDLIFMREFLDIIRFENECGHDYKIMQCSGKASYLYRIHDDSAMGQLHSRIENVADSILYRARWALERYRTEDQPKWYTANYQEYVNLHMQEYMLFYFPALHKPLWKHLMELKKEGLYPSPPPKLGWPKEKSIARKIRQFVFRFSAIYPLYYAIMRIKFKKAGSV